MKDIILSFPQQFAKGIEAAEDIKLDGPFSNIIICGVGGSALPGSLIPEMGIKFDLPLFTHRDYGLPKAANQDSLILAISYSGNTEETLSAYKEAIARSYKIIAISTGGKLSEMAEQNNRPAVLIPKTGIQPRCATGYLSAAVLKILSNCEIANNQDKNLLELARALQPENLEEQGKKLAEKLKDKTPIVYASNQYKALARVWKIKLNENSKVMAFWNYFPELNHNEMVGLTNPQGKFHFLILRDEVNDHERNLKRMELFTALAKEAGSNVDFIEIEGKTKLEKIFSTLLLGDWVSYYLAIAYNQDPTPVKIVENFKKRLSQ